MAIEDLIANGIRPPVIQNAQEQQARAFSLKALMEQHAQQQQLGQQGIQEGQIKLAEAQRQASINEQNRQYAIRKFGQAPAQPQAQQPQTDLSAIQPGASAPGPQPQASAPGMIPGRKAGSADPFGDAMDQIKFRLSIGDVEGANALQAKLFKDQETLSIAKKNNAEAGSFDATAQLKHAETQDQIAALMKTNYEAGVQKLVDLNFVTPEKGQHLLAIPPEQRAATIAEYVDHIAQHKRDIADAEEQRKAALFVPQFNEAEANAQTAGVKAAQFDANGMLLSEKKKLEMDQAAHGEAARHNKADERLSGGRLGVEQGRLAVEKARYAFDASGGVSDAAKMAAAGQMSPATLRSMLRSNPGLIGQIRQIDKNFDEGDIDRRFSTLHEFNSTSNTKAGGQALALNTLIHHADLYMQTAEALKNGSFKPGNAIYNKVADAFGSAPPTNAALVARFFAGETGKVATGGVPAEGEINGILKNLGTNNSPEQIAGAGRTLLGIAAGRATPLMERAREAKIDNIVHVLGPDAKEILQRRGFNPETMKAAGGSGGSVTVKVPNGKDYVFPNQQAADNFKQAAGIK